jgi:predicted O-methyltransferase YrrM
MIPDPEEYFRRLLPQRGALLHALEKEAAEENIPIVGPVVGELLALLIRILRAERVLELGCATGYSAIHMAGAMEGAGARLFTLENDPGMADRARENIRKAGLADRIDLRRGDALELMPALDGPFDLAFLDIEKEDYIRALPLCERLLRKGGLLVADNVAFKDSDDFNQALYERPGWRPVHLYAYLPFHSPGWDGICLALRV